jgi:hypothetical protein
MDMKPTEPSRFFAMLTNIYSSKLTPVVIILGVIVVFLLFAQTEEESSKNKKKSENFEAQVTKLKKKKRKYLNANDGVEEDEGDTCVASVPVLQAPADSNQVTYLKQDDGIPSCQDHAIGFDNVIEEDAEKSSLSCIHETDEDAIQETTSVTSAHLVADAERVYGSSLEFRKENPMGTEVANLIANDRENAVNSEAPRESFPDETEYTEETTKEIYLSDILNDPAQKEIMDIEGLEPFDLASDKDQQEVQTEQELEMNDILHHKLTNGEIISRSRGDVQVQLLPEPCLTDHQSFVVENIQNQEISETLSYDPHQLSEINDAYEIAVAGTEQQDLIINVPSSSIKNSEFKEQATSDFLLDNQEPSDGKKEAELKKISASDSNDPNVNEAILSQEFEEAFTASFDLATKEHDDVSSQITSNVNFEEETVELLKDASECNQYDTQLKAFEKDSDPVVDIETKDSESFPVENKFPKTEGSFNSQNDEDDLASENIVFSIDNKTPLAGDQLDEADRHPPIFDEESVEDVDDQFCNEVSIQFNSNGLTKQINILNKTDKAEYEKKSIANISSSKSSYENDVFEYDRNSISADSDLTHEPQSLTGETSNKSDSATDASLTELYIEEKISNKAKENQDLSTKQEESVIHDTKITQPVVADLGNSNYAMESSSSDEVQSAENSLLS